MLGTIGVLQYFLVPLVLNSGDGRPAGTTFFFNVFIYKTFFTFQNMSAGATQAWFLFLIILAITLTPVLERAILGLLRGGAR